MYFYYKLLEEQYISEDGICYSCYGIQCWEQSETEQLLLHSISDISTDRSSVEWFAKRCTDGQVHPIHLADIVEESFFECPEPVTVPAMDETA